MSIQIAKNLAKEDKVGWLTPEGLFIEAVETGGGIAGLTLGRHEATALSILESRRDLLLELNLRRQRLGCRTWPDTTRFNLIKAFMVEKGYIRVAPDILNMSDFD